MLDLRTYLIKEHAGLMKLTDTYDIFDAESNEKIGHAKEEISGLMKILRLLVNKQMLPTQVHCYEEGRKKPVFIISRGFTFFRSRVEVKTADGELIGYFKSKIFSLGGGFYLYDSKDRQFGEVKGDWKGWNFKLLDNEGNELGTVTKKWAGLAKEFFTSADNYVVALNKEIEHSETTVMLLLAAGLAIDTVFKERG